MFKVFEFFQQAVRSCNVFISPVNLRYKLEPDYKTVAGGLVSIILVILLVGIFFNAWVELLNKEDIASSTEVIRESDPSYFNVNSNDFMFTIGINGLNLTDKSQKKYFNLKMTKYDYLNKGIQSKKNVTSFQLEPCTEDHWNQLGQEFVDTYKRQGLSGFLCLPKNATIEFAGKYTSEKFIYYKISFEKCVGNPDCQTQAQIDAWVNANTSFYFNFYYSNTLLNPDQKETISMFFEDKDYTMFSPTMATSTNLYVGEYVMETDQSIFPWVQKNVENGFIINRGQKQSWNYMSTPSEPYAKFYLRKSNVKLQIKRTFRKLDDMLSYIGGLFGIITVVFGFVMNYYGQCCFELQMCQNIFDYHNKKQNKESIKHHIQSESHRSTEFNQNSHQNHENGDQWWQSNQLSEDNFEVIQPKDFGFFDFFLHILVYIPLKKICNINWRRMQIYEESLEEMRNKLDISQLMEKLAFYDRSINALFDESQLKLLYLQEKFNFQEVRDQRKMLGLRKDIVANLFGMVFENIENSSDQLIKKQEKKSLKQIALQRSSKRIHTFIGAPALNFLEIFAKAATKSNEDGDDDINLPPEIKSALKKLDAKIQEGDVTSIRIYNGLQYELLEAFEKSKLNRNKYCVTKRNVKPLRRNKKKEEGPLKEKRKEPITFAELDGAESVSSIQLNKGI